MCYKLSCVLCKVTGFLENDSVHQVQSSERKRMGGFMTRSTKRVALGKEVRRTDRQSLQRCVYKNDPENVERWNF